VPLRNRIHPRELGMQTRLDDARVYDSFWVPPPGTKTVLGTAQLSGGKATLTISSLAVGSTTVTVTYCGDSNIAKSSAVQLRLSRQCSKDAVTLLPRRAFNATRESPG